MIKRSLSLLHSVLSLPDSATPKHLLIARCNGSPRKGLPCRIIKHLTDFSLPSIFELSNSLPSKAAWKAHIKKVLYTSIFTNFSMMLVPICHLSLMLLEST